MHGAPAKKTSLPGHRGLKAHQQHLASPTQGPLRMESGRQCFPEAKKCPPLLLQHQQHLALPTQGPLRESRHPLLWLQHPWRHLLRPPWRHLPVSDSACCR